MAQTATFCNPAATAAHTSLFVGMAAVLHFLVDCLCLCCLYLTVTSETLLCGVSAFVVYNVLAFLTQPFTGWIADSLHRSRYMLYAAVILLTLAAVLATLSADSVSADSVSAYGVSADSVTADSASANSISPLMKGLVPFLLGLGNSMFHVWGGREVTLRTGNDMRALGVFVSTGAFGLAVGFVFCSWAFLSVLVLAIALITICLELCIPMSPIRPISPMSPIRPIKPLGLCVLLVLAVMVVVALRSFVGESFTSGFSHTKAAVLGIGLVAMAGKMAGGWIARWMGIVVMLLLVLVVVIGCLLFRSQGIALLLAGFFAVNCTMPVTLYWANALLPRHEGLAFGLLAAALMPGYLLATL